MMKLRVNQADSHLIRKEIITSGAHYAFYVQFDFDESWNGLTKIAQFRAGETLKSWILPEDHICTIPWEVLITPELQLEIGVCGMDGEEVILPTIWVNAGLIHEGAAGGTVSLTDDIEQALAAI